MDPNANLAEQREILARYSRGNITGSDSSLDDMQRLAELVQAMDEWLSHGGFLPGAWASLAHKFSDEKVAIRCPQCRGTAIHEMDCSLRADPLPWEQKR